MYLDFFGLKDHPFRLTPDADFLYLSPQHARAKACMEQACQQRDALVLITGEVGCGKSILVNRVIDEMDPDVAVARLTQTNLDSGEFLQSVLSQFGCHPFERERQKLMSLLDNFLFAQNVRERPVVLIVEEAQNLSRQVLEVVCELADLEEDSEKLISIVLVGLPALRERLSGGELEPLADRVRATAHLDPLDQAETVRFIRHRMRMAGCSEVPFDDTAFATVFEYSGGVPRLIVSLCDTALTAAYVEESTEVTTEILRGVIAELDLEPVAEADPELTTDDIAPDEERVVFLTVLLRGQALGDFSVGDTRVMIGRDSDNDVTLVSEFISRHHAQIVMDHDGRYWVKDLNSTNGIYLNGKRTQRSRLQHGDRVMLGHHELLFHDSADNRAAGSTTELSGFRDTTVLATPVDKTGQT